MQAIIILLKYEKKTKRVWSLKYNLEQLQDTSEESEYSQDFVNIPVIISFNAYMYISIEKKSWVYYKCESEMITIQEIIPQSI